MKDELFTGHDKLRQFSLFLFALVLPVSIAFSNIALGLMFISFMISWFGRNDAKGQNTVLDKPILIFLLFSLISAFFAINPRTSLIALKSEVTFLVFFLTVYGVKSKEDLKKAIAYFIIGTIFVSLLGLLQYLLRVNIQGGEVIYAPEYLRHWPLALLKYFSLNNDRIVGTRSHWLTFAEGISLALVFLYAFILTKQEFSSGFLWAKKVQLSILLFLGLVLVVSFTRGPWVATFSSILIMTLIKAKRNRKFLLRGIVFIVMIISAGVIFSVVLPKGPFSVTKRLTQMWDQERIYMWESGVKIIKDHPGGGIGVGNIARIYPDYANPKAREVKNWGELHNNYIQIAVERGLPGLLFYLWIIGSALWYFNKSLSSGAEGDRRQVVSLAAMGVVINFLLLGITECVSNDSEIIMIFWFLVGLAMAARIIPQQRTR